MDNIKILHITETVDKKNHSFPWGGECFVWACYFLESN